MSFISILVILIVAFLAGMESVLDQFQFHQPIVACTLIGLACGDITKGILLGGSLQLLALGWMNIGASTAPDAALASVASAILVCGPAQQDVQKGIGIAIALAIAGLALTVLVRFVCSFVVHVADRLIEQDNYRGAGIVHIACVCLQGVRVAIPALIICLTDQDSVKNALDSIPAWMSSGMSVAGGVVVVVGFAMVINMMATPEVWPFFFIGFCLGELSQLNLIAMGAIGVSLALIYIALAPKFNVNANTAVAGGGSADELDDILNDF